MVLQSLNGFIYITHSNVVLTLVRLSKIHVWQDRARWSLQDRARLGKIIVLHDFARLSIRYQARSCKIDQDRPRSSKIKQD